MSATETKAPEPTIPGGDVTVALLVFVCSLGAYLANGDFLPCSDATATTYLAHQLIDGEVTFTPEDAPAFFLVTEDGPVKRGSYLVPTADGRFANTFGFGTAVTALPVFVAARVVVGELDHAALWMSGKIAASIMTAGSVAFVFLAARRLGPRSHALIAAAGYGLGTCVWTLSSQALWQHPANALALAAGAFLFVRGWRPPDGASPTRSFIAAGVALSWAVACRPTSLLVIAAAAGALAVYRRRDVLPFLAATLPVGAVIAAYNGLMFGSPLRFGQTVHTATSAEYLVRKGVDSPWTWQLWDGAAGLLISPSRGLLIYSPFLVFALLGLVRAFREDAWRPLRGLGVAVVALWLVAFAWFDWWGGWSYGYRPLVDTMPLLCLFLVPALGPICRVPALRVAFAIALLVGIGVQALGAFAYNGRAWNNRTVYEVAWPDGTLTLVDDEEGLEVAMGEGGQVARAAALNVDLPEHRHRLWSIADSQILHYLTFAEHSRRAKIRDQAAWLRQFEVRP